MGIAVDEDSRAYVTGFAESSNFPTTAGAFNTSFNGGDVFVTKLNASGSALAYSTFLGGTSFQSDEGIAVREGRAYVTGNTASFDYPTTAGAFDRILGGGSDAFVTKLNASGSALANSTFLGGANLIEESQDIAVDRMGRTYVTGTTSSADFPTTVGAFDRTFIGGLDDAFVTKLPTS